MDVKHLIKYTLVIYALCMTSTVLSQDKTNRFGFKAGFNSSKYTPNEDMFKYESRIGFYAGVFYQISLDQKFDFKPEVLFSLQGSSIKINNILITDINGDPVFGTEPYDFDFEVYDYVIAIPLNFKYHLTNNLYLNAGPQFNFIIEQTFQTDQQLLDGTGNNLTFEDGESFEFGLNIAAGYDISDQISIQAGFFSAIGNRENEAKSFVLNFGLEYRL